MKKILVIVLCAFLLALNGCSKKNEALVSDADQVLIQSEKETLNKGTLNTQLKAFDYSSFILIDLLNKIAVLRGYDIESFNKEADEYIQDFIDQGYEYYLDYQGGEEIVRKSYVVNLILTEVIKEQAALIYDEKVQEDCPVKIQVAYFDDLESANAAKEAISNGSTFDMAALENGFSGDPSEQVITSTSDSVPTEVITYINSVDLIGVSDIITTATTTTDDDGNVVDAPRYYLINIVDRNPDNFKDEYLEILGESIDTTEALNNLFAQYNIEFYDQRTYELMSDTYEGLKK